MCIRDPQLSDLNKSVNLYYGPFHDLSVTAARKKTMLSSILSKRHYLGLSKLTVPDRLVLATTTAECGNFYMVFRWDLIQTANVNATWSPSG